MAYQTFKYEIGKAEVRECNHLGWASLSEEFVELELDEDEEDEEELSELFDEEDKEGGLDFGDAAAGFFVWFLDVLLNKNKFLLLLLKQKCHFLWIYCT